MVGDISIDHYDFGEVRKNYSESISSTEMTDQVGDNKIYKGSSKKRSKNEENRDLYEDKDIGSNKKRSRESASTPRQISNTPEILNIDGSSSWSSKAFDFYEKLSVEERNESLPLVGNIPQTETLEAESLFKSSRMFLTTPEDNIFTRIRLSLDNETTNRTKDERGGSPCNLLKGDKEVKSIMHIAEELNMFSENVGSRGEISSHYLRSKAQFEEHNTERFLTNNSEDPQDNLGDYEYRRKSNK